MSKTQLATGVAVVAGIAVISIFFIFKNPFAMQPEQSAPVPVAATSTNSLVVQDEKIGTGDIAQAGDQVSVDYTGRLQNGTVFDSSEGKTPIQFVLGAGNVIPGWEQGLQGMKVGGKRLLIIPPSLAYGARAIGPIPANSTLIFEVTLVSVDHPAATTPTPTQ